MIVERAIAPGPARARPSSTPSGSIEMQAQVEQVYVDPALIEYSVRLANATRRPAEVGLGELARYISFGASPRASINLILAARALAFIRGRDYVLPHDVTDLALDVLRHRLVLSYEALSDDVTADAVLTRVLAALPVPDAPLRRSAADAMTGAPDRLLRRLEWQVIRRLDGRLQGAVPHGVPRHRHRLRRPARVHPRGRRPAHRLERDRPAGRAVRPPVHRGPRPHRLAGARPVGLDAVRRRPSTARTRCSPTWPSAWPGCSPTAATGSARSSTTTGASG